MIVSSTAKQWKNKEIQIYFVPVVDYQLWRSWYSPLYTACNTQATPARSSQKLLIMWTNMPPTLLHSYSWTFFLTGANLNFFTLCSQLVSGRKLQSFICVSRCSISATLLPGISSGCSKMGKILSKIFGNKEMRILMLGLDAAGKTSKSTYIIIYF